MTAREEFEQMSTQELRERAFSRAKKRLDVGFFWNLLEAVPAAEAAAGHLDEAREDVMRLAARVTDLLDPDSPEEEEAFRPLYLDYLSEAEDA